MADEPDRWADLRPEGAAQPPTFHPTLQAFVENVVADILRVEVTDTNGRTWCPDWWRHPGAVAVLTAMWSTWEALRLDLSFGDSTWLRDHAYPHMAWLMDPTGPFRGCTARRGHSAEPLGPLPTTPPPPGWWVPGDTE